jgi:hypothetical protein
MDARSPDPTKPAADASRLAPDSPKRPSCSPPRKSESAKRESSKKASDAAKPPTDSKEEDEEEEYVVERILDYRVGRNGRRMYRIKWEGYETKDSTWQREDEMNCPDILARFWEERGEQCAPPAKPPPPSPKGQNPRRLPNGRVLQKSLANRRVPRTNAQGNRR